MSSRNLSCTFDLAQRLSVKTVGLHRPLSRKLLGVLVLGLQSKVKKSKVKNETRKDIYHGFLGLSERSAYLMGASTLSEKNEQLELFMNCICRLGEVSDIRTLLAEVPSEPVMSNLITIMKLADAAALLHSIAREFPLARNMRFVAAELPEKAFTPMPIENCEATLREAIPSEKVWEKSKEGIYKSLGISEHDADRQISQDVQKTLTEAKIHAEVQLIYYCELNASDKLLWPRVVSSSKDPCWLCHTFIQSHGKVHTSNCQGKLYPKWRLPLLPGYSNAMADHFNSRLRKRISEIVRSMASANH